MATNLNHDHYISTRYGVLAALLAACFFGLSTPFSKLLLGSVDPVMLAALLYTGSWSGLSALLAFRRLGSMHTHEAKLRGKDYLYLLGSILSGGMAAPLLLIYGLTRTSGAVASLLLNIEGILTALLAYLVFKEAVGRRIWAAAALMLAATSALTYTPGPLPLQTGSLLVILSSLMWAVDNNLTRQLSHRDPYVIARYKGFFAGAVNMAAAFSLKETLPPALPFAGALALGALGYGASLVLFIYALRNLGTSRTSTYFGAAPFIGMVASIIILNEKITFQLLAASALMLTGLWLILKEFHEHEHTHEAVCHEHRHVHDEHHDHGHDGKFAEPHCHEHEHSLLTHSHAHVPDLHHYHRH